MPDTRIPDAPAADAATDTSRASDGRDTATGDDGLSINQDGSAGRDGSRDTNNRDAASPDAIVKDAPTLADGSVEAGPPPNGTCERPFIIPSDLSHVDIQVDTSNAEQILTFPCATNGKDVVLQFDTDKTASLIIYADTFGATWDTALFFSDSCSAPQPAHDLGGAVCNDNACGTNQSQAMAVVGYGHHYLIVSGANGASGQVTVHFQSAIVGQGGIFTLPAGSGSAPGTLGSASANSSLCEASGAWDNYWWGTCPDYAGGTLTASTCNGASYDTVLVVQIPRSDMALCNDDDAACGMQSSVSTTVDPGAGLNVLTVAAATSHAGAYTLTYHRP